MEALGVAASVAGVLSLVGQSIHGITQLQDVVKAFQKALETQRFFLQEVDFFQSGLGQVQLLLEQLSTDFHSSICQLDLEPLQWQMSNCRADVKRWLEDSKQVDPASFEGIRAFFKRLRVAANKEGFSEFRSRIARHQRAFRHGLRFLV